MYQYATRNSSATSDEASQGLYRCGGFGLAEVIDVCEYGCTVRDDYEDTPHCKWTLGKAEQANHCGL